jgi:D-sedoheptulose 7-phosphate isomerase
MAMQRLMKSFDPRGSLMAARSVLDALLADERLVAQIAHATSILAETLTRGNTLLICGNGGSLCDAQHFAEELTGRFRADRPPLAALACADAGHITCTANDYGFEQVFARWVTAHAKAGDCLILLSTSGNSPNCLLAAQAAKSKGAETIALLGKGGGKLAPLVDQPIMVPGLTADRIQELHMLILHIFVEGIEHALGYSGGTATG